MWDPAGDETGGPPGLDESDGEDTIPYRDAESDDDDDDDQQFDSALVLEEGLVEDSFTQCLRGNQLEAYLNDFGTQVEDAAVEILDAQNGASACWSSAERELPE